MHTSMVVFLHFIYMHKLVCAVASSLRNCPRTKRRRCTSYSPSTPVARPTPTGYVDRNPNRNRNRNPNRNRNRNTLGVLSPSPSGTTNTHGVREPQT